MTKKSKYVFEVGDKVEGLPKPRNFEIAENCMGDGKNEFMSNPKVFENLITIIESRKKAKFFRRLKKVLDNKLIEPSIIIEYINQNQRGNK